MEHKPFILIIDDEPDFVETMQFFLQNANFRVIVASSGKEGLKKAIYKPDLILTDLRMPGMDGHEVCRHLKENDATKNIPVIMLTVNDQTLDKVEAFDMGADDYICKDFPFEEILARIKAALRKSSTDVDKASPHRKNSKIIELRNIIDTINIKVLFQSIIQLFDRKIIGYEALTRGPVGSFLESPVFLFDLATELDMFTEIDIVSRNLSIQKAVNFLKQDQYLFLNIDPRTLDTAHFKNLEFLKGSILTPAQICMEISERTFITNFEKTSSALAFFKKKGIKVAIDDVGTGYSSLRSIIELGTDFIKVDMALVRAVDTDHIKSSLIQALIMLADKLKCSIIAEGIETEGEYKTLNALGVQYGQGFYFSKPCENPENP